jgi:hypothetical protein
LGSAGAPRAGRRGGPGPLNPFPLLR